MGRPRTVNVDLYAGLGTSIVTSNEFFVGDANEITLQVIGGSASTLTVMFSNVTGPFAAVNSGAAIAEAEWSTVTTIVSSNNNFVNIEPGMRWMRFQRTSAASRAILGLQGAY